MTYVDSNLEMNAHLFPEYWYMDERGVWIDRRREVKMPRLLITHRTYSGFQVRFADGSTAKQVYFEGEFMPVEEHEEKYEALRTALLGALNKCEEERNHWYQLLKDRLL